MKSEKLTTAKRRLKDQVGSLYEQSGGDTSRCEFCRKKLDSKRSWRRGLDGAGAHESCIRRCA